MKRNKILSWLLTLALGLGLSSCAVSPASEAAPQSMEQASGLTGELQVDFLDVGQADSALVRCGGEAMLIDGGNVADSSYVVSFLNAQQVTHLDYVVASHAHEDHAGGLSGPLNTCTVDHVYCPVTQGEGKYFASLEKYTAAQGLSIEVPQVGDTWELGEAVVTVLGPTQSYEEANNTSLVLSVDYGSTSVLFTGDMEAEAEEDLLASGANLSATVLKVGHHGSDTSTSEAFLSAVSPRYGVISVGADNGYGHPSQAVLDRLSRHGVETWLTRDCGNITLRSDGTQVTWTWDRGTPASPSPSDPEGEYIGNRRSQVFHRSSCPNLPKADNQILFSTRQEALDAGYHPCGNCNP